MLNVRRGAALYVGALIGPGLLLVPALAAQAAGPAAIVAWIGLILISAPMAFTFAALGVRHPIAGGVSAYVREAFGDLPAGVTGLWFITAVICGAPAVTLTGGYYLADLTGSGTVVAVATGLAMYGLVISMNLIGVRVSSGIQFVLSAVLVAVIAVAVIVTVPSRVTHHWTPFAPHGWWAVGTAANILVWLFVGWEAMAQMAGDFKNPERDLPRAVTVAYVVIALLYSGLAVATIVTASSGRSRVPLADLMSLGFGQAGRDITVALAITLTVGTVNVYIGSASKLAASLASARALPGWLADTTGASIPRRPLAVFASIDVCLFVAVQLKLVSADDLVRATSACFVAVYLLALGSGVRILPGAGRVAALVALASMCVVAVFSAEFLLLPAAAAIVSLLVRSRRRGTPPRPGAIDLETEARAEAEIGQL